MENILAWLLMCSLILFVVMLMIVIFKNTFLGINTKLVYEGFYDDVNDKKSKNALSKTTEKKISNQMENLNSKKNNNNETMNMKNKRYAKKNPDRYANNYIQKYNSYKEYKQKNNISR